MSSRPLPPALGGQHPVRLASVGKAAFNPLSLGLWWPLCMMEMAEPLNIPPMYQSIRIGPSIPKPRDNEAYQTEDFPDWHLHCIALTSSSFSRISFSVSGSVPGGTAGIGKSVPLSLVSLPRTNDICHLWCGPGTITIWLPHIIQHHPAYSSHCSSFAKNLYCIAIVFFPLFASFLFWLLKGRVQML